MSGSNETGIPFPARISSIEKFHLLDDSAELPNELFCRMTFSGTADPAKIVAASRLVESRHPMYRAAVDCSAGGLPVRWVETANENLASENVYFVGSGEPDIDPPGAAPMDVTPLDTEKCSARMYIRQSHGEFEILFQVHHGIVDGGGGIQAINDWLIAYDNVCAGRAPGEGVRSLRPELFPRRSALGLGRWKYLKHLFKQPVGLLGVSKFLFRSFATLQPEHESVTQAHESDFTRSFHGRWIDEVTATRLREQANREGVTLNSILMAALFSAVDEFVAGNSTGADQAGQWIRMIVPMSERSAGDRRLSAVNKSSIVQIDRRKSEMKNRNLFVSYLDREIRIIRDWQLSKLFLIAVRSMSAFPFWLKRSASNAKPRGTLIFTNLGNPFSRNRRLGNRNDGQQRNAGEPGRIQVGDLHLIDFDFAGPVKPGTPVNFAIQQHFGRIRVSMRIEPRQIAELEAARLFDLFVDRINDIAKS